MTFCQRYGLQAPILQAPMAGSCSASLAAAVANAGGMGGLGALRGLGGQSAALARPEPAGDFVRRIWEETQALLP